MSEREKPENKSQFKMGKSEKTGRPYFKFLESIGADLVDVDSDKKPIRETLRKLDVSDTETLADITESWQKQPGEYD